MAEQNGVTTDQLLAILKQMKVDEGENLKEFARELAKGTPEQQEERERQRQAAMKRAREGADIAKAEEQGRITAQQYCPHGTPLPNGAFRHAFQSTGVKTPKGETPYWTAICQQCRWLSPKIIATPDQLQNGVNLNEYKNMTREMLEDWSKKTLVAA